MNHDNYPLYGTAIVVGGALALVAGFPPFLLILLVACPLMVFFMMSGGMHDGSHSEHRESDVPYDARLGRRPTRSSYLDGSHYRNDRP